jgi:hypothetical protein
MREKRCDNHYPLVEIGVARPVQIAKEVMSRLEDGAAGAAGRGGITE